MALPACFHLADDVFPRVRAEAARRLVAEGRSQRDAAHAVGVSQALVRTHIARAQDDDPLVLRLADDLAAGRTGAPDAWCDLLATRAGDREQAALADLLAAERRLLDANPLKLMPQIGINIARALPGAAGPQDVLAFPARLAEAAGRIVRPAPPALGASNHLSRCLLTLRQHHDVCAIANVRGGPDVAIAVKNAGHALAELAPGDDVDARFAAAAPHATVLHDPGHVGIEPCLYIAGPTAGAVLDTLLSIHEALP